MGTAVSKLCRIRQKDRHPDDDDTSLLSQEPTVIDFIQTADPFLIESQLVNRFTIGSTHDNVQFEHSEKYRKDIMGKLLDENDFKWYQMLGVGSFGIVFHATRKATGKHYAIKLQTMDTLRFNANKKTRDKHLNPRVKIHIERTVLAACNGHPFIINLAYAFTTERYAALVLDFMAAGTLDDMIKNGCLSRKMTKFYIIEITLALHFIHSKGILYRDLKPQNILVDQRNHLKLTDFGFAGSMIEHSRGEKNSRSWVSSSKTQSTSSSSDTDISSHDIPCSKTVATGELQESGSENENASNNGEEQADFQYIRKRTFCGTPGYRAIEMVKQKYIPYDKRSGYNEKVDWFALGVTAHEMMTKSKPFLSRKQMAKFPKLNDEMFEDHMTDVDESVRKHLLNDLEFQSLVTFYNYKEDHLRDKLQSSIFISVGLLNPDPTVRFGYNEVVKDPWMKGEVFDASVQIQRKVPLPDFQRHDLNRRRDSEIQKRMRRTVLDMTSLSHQISSYITDRPSLKSTEDGKTLIREWSEIPHESTTQLFQHWHYMSNDSIKLEVDTANQIRKKRAKAWKITKIISKMIGTEQVTI